MSRTFTHHIRADRPLLESAKVAARRHADLTTHGLIEPNYRNRELIRPERHRLPIGCACLSPKMLCDIIIKMNHAHHEFLLDRCYSRLQRSTSTNSILLETPNGSEFYAMCT